MTLPGPGSVTRALTRSLVVGLSLLWLAGVVGSGFVLKRLIDDKSDDELMESAAIMMSLVRHTDDLLVAAAVLGEVRTPHPHGAVHERFVYQVRDASGRVLLHSHNAPPELAQAAVAEGFVDAGDWRVATVADPASGRILQLADPLAERRDALARSMLWLTLPLAALLAFAVLFVYRASRTLVRQVQRTASAVSRQDPQALGMLPLDGVVTEMKPAVEAANRLFARFADAFEAERSFTYNSAHELRTPIAAALAQAQLLEAMAEGSPLATQARATVDALQRLSRLAERLLALARAEGNAPLADDWVDLAQVARLVADEFRDSGRLNGRRLVVDAATARVRGDFDAVGLAVRNLVENALVHGAGGTTIRVACGGDRRVATIAVVDDGPGVPGAELPSLLKRFARGQAARGAGTGLGLSIVDMLARRMGARLVLTSPPAGQRSGLDARLVWETTG